MFIHLVESRRRRERSFGGTALSTVAHVAIGVFLVYETATANPRGRPADVEVPRFIPLPDKPSHAPPASKRAMTSSCDMCIPARPIIAPVIAPSTDVPTISTAPPIVADDFGRPTISGIASSTGARGDGTPMDPAFVEKNALPFHSNAPPRYPEMLRSTSVEGRVVMQFVVDTLGRVEEPSIREIASTNVLFATAARDALLRWRFTPAESGDHKVRVRLEQPFDFKLAR